MKQPDSAVPVLILARLFQASPLGLRTALYIPDYSSLKGEKAQLKPKPTICAQCYTYSPSPKQMKNHPKLKRPGAQPHNHAAHLLSKHTLELLLASPRSLGHGLGLPNRVLEKCSPSLASGCRAHTLSARTVGSMKRKKKKQIKFPFQRKK